LHFSTQKLALLEDNRQDVETVTIYWHDGNKQDIVELKVDKVHIIEQADSK